MTHTKRLLTAYILGRKIANIHTDTIYDQTTGNSSFFNGDVAQEINVYDTTRASYITGNTESIYDTATNEYINYEINGNTFTGYDTETRTYFSGTVEGTAITINDAEDNNYYIFNL